MVTINIKSDMPPADIAVANMVSEIEYYSKTPEKVLKIIHGYGSSGVGGEIKKEVHCKLAELVHKNIIEGYVKGESFGSFNPLIKKIYDNAPELILDTEMHFNGGLTIVLLK